MGFGICICSEIMEFGLQWVHIISSPSCSHSPFMFAFTWLTAFNLAVSDFNLAEYPTAEKMRDVDEGKTGRVGPKRDASQGGTPEIQIEWWMCTKELTKRNLCSFHQSGTCNRGLYCLYAHTEKELNTMPEPWVVKHLAENRKTELCPRAASCQRPDCQYAHGDHELGKEKPKRLKTKLCSAWQSREGCRFGQYCQFAHGSREMGKEMLEWKMKLCETWKQTKSCKVHDCPDAHGVEQIERKTTGRGTSRGRSAAVETRRERSRSRSPFKVLPIIIQSCSLFPVHSNPSAT